jgi:hypothetical protein
MRIGPLVAVVGYGALVGCGGGGSSAAPLNPYLGTLTISGGTTSATCLTTHQVTFQSGTVSTHTVSAVVGDCVSFTNSDTSSHQPNSLPTGSCPDLDDASPLAPGASYTSPPFGAAKVCNWQDLLNPPSTGGGSGGGY